MLRAVQLALLFIAFGLTPASPSDAADPRPIGPHPADDRRPSWSPNGDVVFETDRDGRWQIYETTLEGWARRLIDSPHQDRQARWSPDGSRLVFQRTEKGESPQLYLLDAQSGKTSLVRTFPGALSDPEWSPDGGSLVFVSKRDGTPNLILLDLRTGQETPLTTGKHRSLWPRWSAQGPLVYFSRSATAGRHDDIFLLTAPFGKQKARRLTSEPDHEFCPDISRDGSKIVYAKGGSKPGGTELRELRILDIETGEQKALASGFERINAPTWSADGRFIVFSAKPKGGNYDIYRVQTQGSPAEKDAPEDTVEKAPHQ